LIHKRLPRSGHFGYYGHPLAPHLFHLLLPVLLIEIDLGWWNLLLSLAATLIWVFKLVEVYTLVALEALPGRPVVVGVVVHKRGNKVPVDGHGLVFESQNLLRQPMFPGNGHQEVIVLVGSPRRALVFSQLSVPYNRSSVKSGLSIWSQKRIRILGQSEARYVVAGRSFGY